jgi:hypothetical protein
MTPKQIERVRSKIKQIRATLAAEKRKFGAYDDSRGLRYLPLEYYIKLQDYKGGLTYTRWFQKNFPDDIGFPDFLFEWTIILFKIGKIEDTEKMAVKTYFSNTYLFDKFFNRPIVQIDKYESSNWESPDIIQHFNYSSNNEDLLDFSNWLEAFEETDRFKKIVDRFLEIQKVLKHENSTVKRRQLLNEIDHLAEEAQ